MGKRFTIHVSNELAQAIDAIAAAESTSRSRLVEILLRENDWVRRHIRSERRIGEDPDGTTDDVGHGSS